MLKDFEALEERRLLSVSLNSTKHVLSVGGTSHADSITVKLDHSEHSTAFKTDHGVGEMPHIGDVRGDRPFAPTLTSKAQLVSHDTQHDHGP